jgi:TRAP-type C4-dicarboxylate transport system substrate-binding protein
MPILELSDEQVVDLVKQLPPERQRAALLALAAGAGQRREERMKYAEQQLQQRCAKRGLDWDKMSEDEREAFIDDLVHEDRPCAQ